MSVLASKRTPTDHDRVSDGRSTHSPKFVGIARFRSSTIARLDWDCASSIRHSTRLERIIGSSWRP